MYKKSSLDHFLGHFFGYQQWLAAIILDQDVTLKYPIILKMVMTAGDQRYPQRMQYRALDLRF